MTDHDDYHDAKIYSQKEMDHAIATLTAEREKVRELVEAVERWERSKWTGDIGEAGRASGEMIALAAQLKEQGK